MKIYLKYSYGYASNLCKISMDFIMYRKNRSQRCGFLKSKDLRNLLKKRVFI